MARRLALALPCGALLAALLLLPLAGALRAAPAPAGLRSVTLGMGYVPNVQFAPFYVADQRGYYRQAGINVHFSYGSSPNLLELVGAGKEEFAIADGTDALTARANSIPVSYVATLYRRLPVAIFSLSKRGIKTVRDLRGKTVGVPGRFGSTYVGLLAALHVAGLRLIDVNVRTVGYTQAETVVQGAVDAAVGYSNNEPLLLRRHGFNVTTIEVGATTDLVGPGLLAGSGLISREPDLVRRFVQATLHGLSDTIADPKAAFALCRRVHGLDTLHGSDVGDQYAVLLRSIALWHDAKTRAHGLGYIDPAQWRQSAQLLRAIGQLPHQPAISSVATNRFAAGAPRR